jgi:hypothetical protein
MDAARFDRRGRVLPPRRRRLRDGKIAEFWLLANVDFDYKE